MLLNVQTVGLAIVLYAIYRAFLAIKLWKQENSNGCKPLNQKPAGNFFTRTAKLAGMFKASQATMNQVERFDQYNKYGRTFGAVTLIGQPFISTIDPKIIQIIFSSNTTDWVTRPMRHYVMKDFMEDAFITTDGAAHEHSRNFAKPSFHKSRISDLTEFEDYLGEMMKEIPMDGSTVDMQAHLLHLFTDTATLFLLGKPVGALKAEEDLDQSGRESKAFWTAFHNSMYGCGLKVLAGTFQFLIPKRHTTHHFRIVHRYLESLAADALREREKAKKSKTLLGDLVKQIDNPVEIRTQLIHSLAAAQDTTPTAISNALYHLAREPQLWERVRAEALTVSFDQGLTAEEMKKLTFIRHVLHESLRMHPVLPNLGRISCNDTILPTGGGPDGKSPVFVPSGTRLIPDFHALHRDASIYGPNPHDFNPDRWDHISPGPWEWMVFGGGPKSCLGMQKAMAEATCTLVRLAQQFSAIESRDDREFTGSLDFVWRNVNGCHVSFTPA